jgi:hypothetical protein
MTINASGRSALILATGLFVCFAGPSHATAGADGATAKSETAAGKPVTLNKYAKHGTRHGKSYAHRRSSRLALKSSDSKIVAAADDGDSTSVMPPSVADANAQLTTADTEAGNVKAMSARANEILQAAPGKPAAARPATETKVVAADQLNDVDRALQENQAPAPTSAMAAADAPAAPVAVSRNESSTWEQTSLIGKLFIGFGALLTMASAARMFMA